MCDRLLEFEEVSSDFFWTPPKVMSDKRQTIYFTEDSDETSDESKVCILEAINSTNLTGYECFKCAKKIFLRRNAIVSDEFSK